MNLPGSVIGFDKEIILRRTNSYKQKLMMKLLSILAVGLVIFSGCSKDDSSTVFQPSLMIQEGGLSNFDYANVEFDSSNTDTVKFTVRFTSAVAFSQDITVTLAITDTSRTNYNLSHDVQYEQMPTEAYQLSQSSVTIKAGSISAELYMVFYKDKLDTSVNTMVPVTIKDAEGKAINTTYSTIYFHYIAIPIVGNYNVTGSRTDYTGSSNDNIVDTIFDLTDEKEVGLIDANTFHTGYANLGDLGWEYLIKFDVHASGGITVEPNDIMQLAIKPGSFEVFSAVYDAVANTIYLKTAYTNNTDDDRIVEETFTKKY